MSRSPNFFYQDNPGVVIGNGLARAMFGDPQMAMQQRQLQAQMDERAAQAEMARSHAKLYDSQTAGQNTQNGAAQSLPELFARLYSQDGSQPAPIPSINDPHFLDNAGPSAAPVNPQESFTAGLGPLLAALAQMQGDKVSIPETVGTLASFLGGDELARRGMVAQGHTPGAAFALTPDRADAIAQQGYTADQNKGVAVAQANHANDIPVANIRAGATLGAANIRAGATLGAAGIRSGAKGDKVKPPRTVSAATAKLLNAELSKFAESNGFYMSPTTKIGVKARVYSNFQQSGNPADAVLKATSSLRVNGQPVGPHDQPPVQGARMAPDGHWYVQTGKHGDGSPAYSRVN